MKRLAGIATALTLVISVIPTAANSQGMPPMPYNPYMDQPPTPVALQMFQSAASAECNVLKQSNPNITNCGLDQLRRNSTLQAWGLSQPGPNLLTITRYNPAPLTAILNQFGSVAAFFVFAHEGGHHPLAGPALSLG